MKYKVENERCCLRLEMEEHVHSRKLCLLPNKNEEFKIQAYTHLAAQSIPETRVRTLTRPYLFVTAPLVCSSSS